MIIRKIRHNGSVKTLTLVKTEITSNVKCQEKNYFEINWRCLLWSGKQRGRRCEQSKWRDFIEATTIPTIAINTDF